MLENWQDQEEEDAHRKERKRLSENHYNRAQSLAAWLLATLVAVNGSATLTTLSRAAPLPNGARLPALAFVVGLILAIISGFSSWRDAQDRSGLYYLESLRPDQLGDEGKRRKLILVARSRWLGAAARYTNYASLAALITGLAWAAQTYT